MRRSANALLGSLCLVSALPVLTGATDLTGNFEARVLASHNRERAVMGVPPLRWNDDLAVSARAWAERLAATGGFEHAPERIADPQGENLWAGTKGHFTVEGMVDGWVREKQNFRLGRFPDNSATGRVEDVGHYTQLIWRRTYQVGCATVAGRTEDVLVCRYSEAGNYRGELPL